VPEGSSRDIEHAAQPGSLAHAYVRGSTLKFYEGFEARKRRRSQSSRNPIHAGGYFVVRNCYGLSGCLPPWTDLTGYCPSHRGLLLPGFRRAENAVSMRLDAKVLGPYATGKSTGDFAAFWRFKKFSRRVCAQIQ